MLHGGEEASLISVNTSAGFFLMTLCPNIDIFYYIILYHQAILNYNFTEKISCFY